MNDKLKTARRKKNWSQEQASQEVGIEKRTYQRWERGESTPQPYHREKLCAAFNLSLNELGFSFEEAGPQTFTNTTALYVVPSHVITPISSFEEDGRDWASWFGIKVADILRKVSLWNGPLYDQEVQRMVDQEIKVMDEQLDQHDATDSQQLSRRQALMTLAALPLSLASLHLGAVSENVAQEFLANCAASLSSCWHLLRGNGLYAVREIMPQYTSLLKTLAMASSQHQKTAARLAAQSSILQAILAMHGLNFVGREAHCKEAIYYAQIAEDANLRATALMYLGYTYSFCFQPKQPEKAITIFTDALKYVGDDAPLLQSNISMGLAEAYAQCREDRQALAYIEQAKIIFPMHPELDPSFVYGDCSLHVLYQWEGKMYMELAKQITDKGYSQQARIALTESVSTQSISTRSTTETLVYQAEVAQNLGELDEYVASISKAGVMALELKSRKRYSEAHGVFTATPERWLREPSIQALANSVFNQSPVRRS
jgi:transcriptional regulator with XRE-family HTH domain